MFEAITLMSARRGIFAIVAIATLVAIGCGGGNGAGSNSGGGGGYDNGGTNNGGPGGGRGRDRGGTPLPLPQNPDRGIPLAPPKGGPLYSSAGVGPAGAGQAPVSNGRVDCLPFGPIFPPDNPAVSAGLKVS